MAMVPSEQYWLASDKERRMYALPSINEPTHTCCICEKIDSINADWDCTPKGEPVCIPCASTCFDCGETYQESILNEDGEAWCHDCVTLFKSDRDAWRERWNARYADEK